MTSRQSIFLLTSGVFLLVPLARPLTKLSENVLNSIFKHLFNQPALQSPSLLTTLQFVIPMIVLITLVTLYDIRWQTIRERFLLPLKTSDILYSLSSLLVALYIAHSPLEYLHIPIYGTVGFLFAHRTRSYFKNSSQIEEIQLVAISLMAATVLSVSDELLQWCHPERFFDPRDLALNFFSSAFGVILSQICYKISIQKKPKIHSSSSNSRHLTNITVAEEI